ncbi:MAG TPA: hypothetical protein VJ063_20610, partial [Verrucomicrobiae bacterium]|nr:hypothetical protein [Verrucomicrobiae bacterium]
NGDILLSFCGNPGSNYVIEASSTLTNWSAIATTTAERHWPLHLRRHQRPFAPTTLLPHQTGMTPLSRRAMRKASESLIHFAPRKS